MQFSEWQKYTTDFFPPTKSLFGDFLNGLKSSVRKGWYWRNWHTTWCDWEYFDLGVTLPGKPSTGSDVVKLLCVLPRLSLAPHDDKQLLSRHTARTIVFLCLSQRVRRQWQKFNIATTIKSETFRSVARYSETGFCVGWLVVAAGYWKVKGPRDYLFQQ